MTTAYLRELGRAIVNFARLEWNLAYAISGLTGPYSAGGQMVALELPFAKKYLLFQSLCRHELTFSSRKASVEFTTLLQRLLECESSLKRISHPLWLAAPRERRGGGPIRSRMTAIDSKAPRPVRGADVRRLKVVADEIARVADAIPPFVRHHAKGTHMRESAARRPTRS